MLLSKRYHIISSITIVSLVLVGFAANSSALTYQSSTDVEFTLNPTLNVTLSSSDLAIDDLVPGSSSDSNVFFMINTICCHKDKLFLGKMLINRRFFNVVLLMVLLIFLASKKHTLNYEKRYQNCPLRH